MKYLEEAKKKFEEWYTAPQGQAIPTVPEMMALFREHGERELITQIINKIQPGGKVEKTGNVSYAVERACDCYGCSCYESCENDRESS